MSEPVNFKRTMFGVSKKNITEYIDKISKDIDDKLLMKDREIASLKKDNEKLLEQIKDFQDKLSLLEAEKQKISDAFVKAEAGAKRIISEATQEADSLIAIAKEDIENQKLEFSKEKELKLAEFNQEIEKHKEIINSYKQEIKHLRDAIKAIAPKFDEILSRYN